MSRASDYSKRKRFEELKVRIERVTAFKARLEKRGQTHLPAYVAAIRQLREMEQAKRMLQVHLHK